MNDQYYIDLANKLLDEKFYTRKSLSVALGISRDKLERLSVNIPKYPRKLTASQAATMSKKTGKWGGKFRLAGSPNYE